MIEVCHIMHMIVATVDTADKLIFLLVLSMAQLDIMFTGKCSGYTCAICIFNRYLGRALNG